MLCEFFAFEKLMLKSIYLDSEWKFQFYLYIPRKSPIYVYHISSCCLKHRLVIRCTVPIHTKMRCDFYFLF